MPTERHDAREDKSMNSRKATTLTSGPLLDWFYVHAGYVNADTGTPVPWDVPEGIELAVQPAEKSEALIVPDRPWEGDDISHLWRVYPHEGKFRMHYRTGNHHLLAESEDGFHWTKPELGVVEVNGSKKNNIVDGCFEHVFEDPSPSTPPEERWKAIGMQGGLYDPRLDGEGNAVPLNIRSKKAMALTAEEGEELPEDVFELQESPETRGTYRGKWAQLKGFLFGLVSPDGLRWTRLKKFFLSEWVDGDNIVRYDETLGKYVGYFRFHLAGRRCVGRSESDDFRTFTPEKVVLQIDSMDPPDTSFYNHSWTKYPGRDDIDLMFVSVFHQGTGKIDIQLAVSHDGFHWDRPDRKTTLIPNGPDGSRDGGCMYVAPELLELPDGRWAIAYSGRAARHIEGKGIKDARKGIIRYAMWKPNRLVGIRAREHGSFTLRQDRYRAPENCPDTIEAPPHNCFPPVSDPNEPPRQLTLNYTTELGGWIRVELIPVIGPMTHPQIYPLEGYRFTDCDTLRGDEIEKVVTWKGKSDIARLSDTMAVRIEMFRATLFSFSLGQGCPRRTFVESSRAP